MQSFKLIIAGGRDFNDRALMCQELNHLLNTALGDYDVTFVSGMARGADLLAHKILTAHGEPVEEFPADWNRHGKRAGFLRNEAMGRYADGVLAFWDGRSRGTEHMIHFMERQGKAVFVARY